jgi:hypothetical protein
MAIDNFENMTKKSTEPAFLDKYIIQEEGGTADEQKYITHEDLFAERGYVAEVTIESEDLLTLNATPVDVLPELVGDKAYIINSVTAIKPAGTAYDGINVNEDIVLRYTDDSGDVLATIETTGFLDQTTKQIRYSYPSSWTTNAASALLAITPVAGAKIVAHMTTDEIATGDTDLVLRINYKIIDVS